MKVQKIPAFILNFPWSLLGLFYGLALFPKIIKADRLHFVALVRVRRLWLNDIFLGRRVRGFTLGNIVLLSDVADSNTYGHEIVHIEQFMKAPLLFPLFYLIESLENGYQGNKYEKEVYQSCAKVKK